MFTKILSFLLSIIMAISSFITSNDIFNNYSFEIDTTSATEEMPNLASNLNVWEMERQFIDAEVTGEYNIFDFVEYVQLMECSGGNSYRDLFKNPADRTVKDDYDFDRLLDSCQGIINLGAKPTLKLGNVPSKLSAEVPSETGDFDCNVYPPEDYNEYYTYIKAIATALVDRFGKDEVLTWHFGVMTEYENGGWFRAIDGTPESSAIEFCKLYDYTVQALVDVLGDDVYVGAHSMTVTEGLWDETIFIEHVAQGTNYANGGTGTHIDYLSTSFYDVKVGEYTSGKTLAECISYLKSTAEKYGLYNLEYGVDEGRILSGTEGADSDAIMSRTTGYTWQAAYDARLYGQLLDEGGSYLSSWNYLTSSHFDGNPSISYHTASNIAKFAGLKRASVATTKKGLILNAEVKVYSGVDTDSGKVRVMAYNYKNDLDYKRDADVSLTIKTTLADGPVKVTIYRIDDDCNYFDEWCSDREQYGFTDDMFSWSPDDGCLLDSNFVNENARAIYKNVLEKKYAECSVLTPVEFETVVENGEIHLDTTISANTVVFWEIG